MVSTVAYAWLDASGGHSRPPGLIVAAAAAVHPQRVEKSVHFLVIPLMLLLANIFRARCLSQDVMPGRSTRALAATAISLSTPAQAGTQQHSAMLVLTTRAPAGAYAGPAGVGCGCVTQPSCG